MAGFADLNLPQGPDKKSLQSLLEAAAHRELVPGHGGSGEGGGAGSGLGSAAEPGGARAGEGWARPGQGG